MNLPSSNQIHSEEKYCGMGCKSFGVWVLAAIACGAIGISSKVEAQTVIGSNFENGSITPFTSEGCCGNSTTVLDTTFPARSGGYATELKWYQQNYQGTRTSRGIEASTNDRGKKETWYGFSFYLPDQGFPKDKSMIIAQQIAWHPNCPTDKTITLYVKPDEIGVNGYSGDGSTLKGRVGGALTKNIARNRWVDVVIHAIFSRSSQGQLEVWFDGATQTQPTLQLRNINLGTGCWVGDTLSYGTYAKFGIYAWDTKHYTKGESRTVYFDNVSYLPSAHTNGFELVNPASANFRRMRSNRQNQMRLRRQRSPRKTSPESLWKDRP